MNTLARPRALHPTTETIPAGRLRSARVAISRNGGGTPIVLLHALGSGRHAWDPIVPALAEQYEVIALDLPGFGDSTPLPSSVTPTPAALAAAVAVALDDADVHSPHVVGNSLGGWVALELAQLRPLASVTLISPAGLWSGSTPMYCRVSLAATRWVTKRVPRLLNKLVGHPLGRILLLGQSHGHPTRIRPDHARAAICAMGTSSGFDRALAATLRLRYAPESPVDAPVTVAFGSRDWILPRRRWRQIGELPPNTTERMLPGCGHLPMADNPDLVTDLVTAAVERAHSSRTG